MQITVCSLAVVFDLETKQYNQGNRSLYRLGSDTATTHRVVGREIVFVPPQSPVIYSWTKIGLNK